MCCEVIEIDGPAIRPDQYQVLLSAFENEPENEDLWHYLQTVELQHLAVAPYHSSEQSSQSRCDGSRSC